MIIFAYLPYGLAEGIKLSGGCTHAQRHIYCWLHENFLIQCCLCTCRNNVHPFCGNCDVSLHPSQLVSCHPDPNAADIAHSGLYVWSVNSIFSYTSFPFFKKKILFDVLNAIFSLCVSFQKHVCLPSLAFPSSASLIILKYPLSSGA